MEVHELWARAFHSEKSLYCGIPDDQPIFELGKELAGSDITFVDDVMLLADRANRVRKYNRFTGELLASCELKPLLNVNVNVRYGAATNFPASYMTRNSRYLVVPPYLLDISSLEVVFNLSDLIAGTDYQFEKTATSTLNEHFWVYEVNREEQPGLWCVVDLHTMQGTLRQTDATMPVLLRGSSDRIACVSGGEIQIRKFDSNEILHRYHVNNVYEMMCDAFGVVISVKGDLQLLNANDLSVVSRFSDTGLVCYKLEKRIYDSCSPLLIIHAEIDPMVQTRQLIVYNWEESRIVWNKPVRDYEIMSVSGDLIFIRFEEKQNLAIDKWTGKIVWRQPSFFSARYMSFFGHQIYAVHETIDSVKIRCYQWFENYNSPSRPLSSVKDWLNSEYEVMDIGQVDTTLAEPVPINNPCQDEMAKRPEPRWIDEDQFFDSHEVSWYCTVISPDGQWELSLYQDDSEYADTGCYLFLKNIAESQSLWLTTMYGSSFYSDFAYLFYLIEYLVWNEAGISFWIEGGGCIRIEIDHETGMFEWEKIGIGDDVFSEFWSVSKEDESSLFRYKIARVRFSDRARAVEVLDSDIYWPDWEYKRLPDNAHVASDLTYMFTDHVLVNVKEDGNAKLIVSTADEAFTQEVLAALASGALTLPVGLEGDDLGGKLRVPAITSED